MKKNTLTALYNYLVKHDDSVDLSLLVEDVRDEYERMDAKRKVNQDMYSCAKDSVFRVLSESSRPMTVKEIFSACGDTLPEGFTSAKIQYAVLHYWNDELVKHDNGKSAFTYSIK